MACIGFAVAENENSRFQIGICIKACSFLIYEHLHGDSNRIEGWRAAAGLQIINRSGKQGPLFQIEFGNRQIDMDIVGIWYQANQIVLADVVLTVEQWTFQFIQRLAVHAAWDVGHKDGANRFTGVIIFFPEFLGLDDHIAADGTSVGLVLIKAVKTIISGQCLVLFLLGEFNELIQDLLFLCR